VKGRSAIVRAILTLYPEDFRDRFGESMEQTLRDRTRAARARGRGPASLTWARGCADLLLNVALVRFQRRQKEPMNWQFLALDCRYAARGLRRSPMFSSLAIIALALGIGANTAIFTVVHSVLLKPLAYDDPVRLMMVWSTNPTARHDRDAVAPLDVMDFRGAASFSGVQATVGFVATTAWISGSGPAERITVTAVTPGLFEMLGRRPELGRLFIEKEDPNAIVISNAFWRTRLGSDPNVVGRVLNIQGQPSTVIGVMPAGFVFPYRAMLAPGAPQSVAIDAWAPLLFAPPPRVPVANNPYVALVRGARFLSVIGRLKPGVTPAQASDEVARIARDAAAAHPETNRGIGAVAVPLHEQAVGSARPALLLLLGGVGLVLLMACANLANMLLARSLSRHREMAIRSALGAERRRLVSQTLMETSLLAAAGGGIGLAAVRWGIQVLVAAAPPTLPRLAEVRADWVVLMFTFALSLLTGITIGIAPAIVGSRADLQHALREGARGASHGRVHRRFRSALVVGEVALALVLTLGAGLLLRSFLSVLSIDPGFRTDHALALQIALPPRYQTPDQLRAFYASLQSRLSSLPGVTALGGTTRLPLGSTNVTTRVAVEGTSAPVGTWPEVEFRRAVYDYFAAMDIPVLRGRTFTTGDGPTAPRVVVINATMARQLFGSDDPVGRRLKLGSPSAAPATIVGVIGDVRHAGLEAAPAAELYIYYLQGPPVNPFLVLRTSSDPEALVAAVRAEVQGVDKEVPVYDIRPMEQVRSDALSVRRFVLLLVSAFGILALVMAATGVYGVMALAVAERRQEIGIRLALGAHPSGVVRGVVGQGVTFAALGIAAGFGIFVVAAPLVASQLFGVRLLDAPTMAAVPALLLIVATVACYLPARRAIAIDPVDALRN
jgi:putative ABC transport system permease protein